MYNGGVTVKETSEDSRQVRKLSHEKLSYRRLAVRSETVAYVRREENHLDATERFIALIIWSTCFGHLYAHHYELETVLVLLPRMVCNALVAGGRRSGAGQQAMRSG